MTVEARLFPDYRSRAQKQRWTLAINDQPLSRANHVHFECLFDKPEKAKQIARAYLKPGRVRWLRDGRGGYKSVVRRAVLPSERKGATPHEL